ncbi:MAG: AarF/ABC1/UbiB kinase family protein [Acidimicrobiia bacterium]|nr:AarF/ABC1/UbiB kinase family protein [Acidimicrobiia bacterium]
MAIPTSRRNKFSLGASRRRLLVPVALVGGLGAAAVAIGVRARRRTAAHHAGGPVRHLGLASRNAQLVGLGAKAGADYATHRARRVFASAERRESLDTEFELRTAEQVAEALGNMKGALMKVGQMASYLDGGLPEHVRSTLAELQRDAPPMAPELAAGVIRRELGAEPDEVFETWDPVPIASASIGQVHRAITRDGAAVAVKVQYPGVEQAMASDLSNVGFLFSGLGQLFPGFDPAPVVAELRERLVEELDYANEAVNQMAFARHYEGHPTIFVPKVFERLSTSKVLTTELAEGVGFDEVVRTWDDTERNLAAETIYRFAFGSLYRLRMFNGDPHPGNYLFRPGGQVTFLDFGLVKHFTEAELLPFEEMIRAMVLEPDPAAFRAIIERVGLLPAGLPFTDEQLIDYFGHFYEFVATDGTYEITSEYASETVRRFFDQRGAYGDIMRSVSLPASFVIIQRINLGLYALFGELRATGNWRRLAEELWPFVDGPPSTPMGETIAEWERAHHGAATPS